MEFIEEHYLGSLDHHTNDMTEKLDSYLKDKDVDLLEVIFFTACSTFEALIVISVESGND